MQALFSKKAKKIVILGTGGTISGLAPTPEQASVYQAGLVSVGDLLAHATVSAGAAADVLRGVDLVSEQVAQIDSKDMDLATWQRLAVRCAGLLADEAVGGVVVTHGTDTLEETAYLLHRVLPADLLVGKAVVLTCAMRPANAPDADGPQNLHDAILVALHSQACGVLALCAGNVHTADKVMKAYSHRMNAFNSGEYRPWTAIENGVIQFIDSAKQSDEILSNENLPALTGGVQRLARAAHLPRVEIVWNHAVADGALVDALLAQRVATAVEAPTRLQGIVVAGTGNGTVSRGLETALLRAQAAGVRVVRSSRCAFGSVQPLPNQALQETSPLPPVKARIDLMLRLLP